MQPLINHFYWALTNVLILELHYGVCSPTKFKKHARLLVCLTFILCKKFVNKCVIFSLVEEPLDEVYAKNVSQSVKSSASRSYVSHMAFFVL